MQVDPDRKSRLLARINSRLPPGIDWKQGAITYLSNLIRNQGAHNDRYHLIKPFLGGGDYRPFTSEMYRFVNMVEKLPLPPGTRILDVGCGPGWVTHYFAKLGMDVTGIDISAELIELAERRLKGDLYPPHDGPWSAHFRLHDIEAEALTGESPFDIAVYESVLHHFFDPVAALAHTAVAMKDTGLLVVIEAEAPAPGTPYDAENQRLMRDYHTIERPYARAELDEMLDITGFRWRKYFYPMNGWFEQTNEVASEVFHHVRGGPGFNLCIAARSAERFEQVFGKPRVEAGVKGFARRVSYALGRRLLNLYRRLA